MISDQPRPLQCPLDPAVADSNPVLLSQLFVEMPYAQIEIPLLVQLQHPLRRFHGNPMHASFAAPLIEQTAVAKLLISLPQSLHIPHAHAGDLGPLRSAKR